LFQIASFTATVGDPSDRAVQAEVREKANKLQELGTASEWLLGPEIKALCCQLATGSRLIFVHRNEEQQNQFEADWLSTEPTDGGKGKYHALYASPNAAVRNQLKLDTLDALLPPSSAPAAQRLIQP
jgi:hypothetical protein